MADLSGYMPSSTTMNPGSYSASNPYYGNTGVTGYTGSNMPQMQYSGSAQSPYQQSAYASQYNQTQPVATQPYQMPSAQPSIGGGGYYSSGQAGAGVQAQNQYQQGQQSGQQPQGQTSNYQFGGGWGSVQPNSPEWWLQQAFQKGYTGQQAVNYADFGNDQYGSQPMPGNTAGNRFGIAYYGDRNQYGMHGSYVDQMGNLIQRNNQQGGGLGSLNPSQDMWANLMRMFSNMGGVRAGGGETWQKSQYVRPSYGGYGSHGNSNQANPYWGSVSRDMLQPQVMPQQYQGTQLPSAQYNGMGGAQGIWNPTGMNTPPGMYF